MRLKRFNAQKESKRLQNYHNKSNNIKKRTILLSAFILVGSIMLLTYASFSSSIKVDVMHSKVGNLVQDDYEIKAYINNTLSNDIPEKEDGYTVDSITCTNDAVGIWDDVKWGILITEAEEPTVCSIYFKTYIEEYDFTETIESFVAPYTGIYKLETWGASGGNIVGLSNNKTGGYGGYSVGLIHLDKDEEIYVVVGQEGADSPLENNELAISGLPLTRTSFNGGAPGMANHNTRWAGGGGATHMATETGELKDLESYKGTLIDNAYYVSDTILIVSGAGGGAGQTFNGGNAGGFIGGQGNGLGDTCGTGGTGGTQISGGTSTSTGTNAYGAFGYARYTNSSGAGAGSGLYAGGAAWNCGASAGGGSGYIASSRLESNSNVTKHMYCYNCPTSNDTETKTESDGTSSCHDEEPTPDCAKEGNGYAKITLLSLD